MTVINLEYRLRIALPAGELVLTSQRGGANPYLSSPPAGDGSEFDPLTGATSIGAYTVRVVDAPVSSGPTVRVVTGQLADSSSRQQFLSRRAVLEYRQRVGQAIGDVPDATAGGFTNAQAGAMFGGAWVTLCTGYVTRVALVSGIEYEIGVGESLRIERAVSAFAPKIAGVDVHSRPVYEDVASYLARWPQRGCLLGGPLTAPWRDVAVGAGWVCQSQGQDAAGNTILRVKSGVLPPAWSSTTDLAALIAQSERATSAFWDPQPIYDALGNPTNTGRIYPGLVVLVDGVPYLTGRGFTAAAGTRTAKLIGTAPGLVASIPQGTNGRGTFTVDGPALASGKTVRVQVVSLLPTAGSPLYWTGHPVDLLARLWGDAGIPYDAASLELTRAAIGGDRAISLRITSTPTLAAWLEANIYGPFGIAVRLNDAGNLEAFAARAVPSAAPTLTLDGTCLADDGDEPFSLDESAAVSRVVLEHELYTAASTSLETRDVPLDGIVTRAERIERANVDATTYSAREQRYTVAGMLHSLGGAGADAAAAVDVLARDVFDRWGRGLVTARVRLVRGAILRALEPRLGSEVLVNHPAMINANRRLGDVATVGARSWQVVAVTQSPLGAELRLADFGPAAQPIATIPAFAIGVNAGDSRGVADAQITNAAALNAAALGVRVQVATTSSSAPPAVTAGADAMIFPAGVVPTGSFALPRVSSGSWVWVRGRTESAAVGRPSSWSAWVGVQLAGITAPSALNVSAIGRESAVIVWTNGSATDPLEVYALPGSVAPAFADWSRYRVGTLPAGSTTTRVRRLAGPGAANVIGIRHVDGAGGRSAVASSTFSTTSSSSGTAPRPAGLSVFTSGALDAQLETGVAVALYAADEVYDFTIWRAPDVAGAPNVGAAVLVDTIPGDSTVFVDYLPSTGATYWYALGHVLSGEGDSTLTPWRSGSVGSIPRDLTRPGAALPVVTATSSETTTTGTIDLVVWDPQGRVTSVEFRTKQTGGTFTAWTPDGSIPYSASVTIPAAPGFGFVEWRVLGYDDLGNLETLEDGGDAFDVNKSADLVVVDGAFTGVGALIASVVGDSDTLSTRVGVSTTSASAAAIAAAAASAVNGRQQEQTFPGPYAIGASVYVAAIAYDAASGGGTASPTTTVRLVRPGSEIIVQEQPSETSSVGTLGVVVTDRAGVVSAVQFRTQQGRGGWSAWTTPDTTTGGAPTFTYAKSVTLVEKVVSKVAYRVLGTDSAGNTGAILDEDVVPFTPGATPAIPDISANVDISTGTVAAIVTGDSDTGSTRLGVSGVSSSAAISNAASAGALSGRVGVYAALTTLAEGGRLYLAAFAYSGAGGTGLVSSGAATFELTRPRDTVGLQCRAVIQSTSATSVSVVVTGIDPTGLTTPSVAISSSVGVGTITGSGSTFDPYVIPRPLFQAGGGRVVFAASASGRATAYDAIDVPERGRDTVALTCVVTISSTSSTSISVVVTAGDPLGAITPFVSIYSSGGLGTITGSGTAFDPYVIPRPTAGGGTGRVVVQATGSGRVTAYANVDVPAQDATGGGSTGFSSAYISGVNYAADVISIAWATYGTAPTYIEAQYRHAGGGTWFSGPVATGGSSVGFSTMTTEGRNIAAVATNNDLWEFQLVASDSLGAVIGVSNTFSRTFNYT